MSYDIYLNDPESGAPILFDQPVDIRGGTYAHGGTREAWLNITYNYSRHFGPLGEKGIRSIYGRVASETLPDLKSAADQLGDDVSANYWEATEGNAKAALRNLIALAKLAPHGVWDGD